MVVWWCFPHIFQVSYSLACLLWFCGAKTVAPGPSWSHNLTINQPMVSGFMRSFVSNIAFRSQWFVATDWIETKNPGSFLLWRFTRASKRLCFFLWTAKDWQCTCVCLVEFEIIWVFVPQVYVHTHKLETYEYTPVMCRYTYNVSIYTQHTHIYIHTHVYIQSLHMSSVYIYIYIQRPVYAWVLRCRFKTLWHFETICWRNSQWTWPKKWMCVGISCKGGLQSSRDG